MYRFTVRAHADPSDFECDASYDPVVDSRVELYITIFKKIISELRSCLVETGTEVTLGDRVVRGPGCEREILRVSRSQRPLCKSESRAQTPAKEVPFVEVNGHASKICLRFPNWMARWNHHNEIVLPCVCREWGRISIGGTHSEG